MIRIHFFHYITNLTNYYLSLLLLDIYATVKIIPTRLQAIDNPNKKELSVVIVDLYIPFILKDLNTHKTSYFTLPMYKYELLKHDDLIKGFDGKEIDFNKFITTYDILKK